MIDKIREIIEPVIREDGAELVEMIYRKEAGKQVLRLLVDKEGGIQLSDCARLNQKIGQVLDQANIIQESYVIEVDSPGIGRPFKIRRDYERAIGRPARITLSERILDKKEYIGILSGISDADVKIDVKKKGIIEMPFEKIVRAREEIEMGE